MNYILHEHILKPILFYFSLILIIRNYLYRKNQFLLLLILYVVR